MTRYECSCGAWYETAQDMRFCRSRAPVYCWRQKHEARGHTVKQVQSLRKTKRVSHAKDVPDVQKDVPDVQDDH